MKSLKHYCTCCRLRWDTEPSAQVLHSFMWQPVRTCDSKKSVSGVNLFQTTQTADFSAGVKKSIFTWHGAESRLQVQDLFWSSHIQQVIEVTWMIYQLNDFCKLDWFIRHYLKNTLLSLQISHFLSWLEWIIKQVPLLILIVTHTYIRKEFYYYYYFCLFLFPLN